MPKYDFSLHVISPMFIAGCMEEGTGTYDRNHQQVMHRIIGPEGDGLRIPSLRGVLRYWFRSLNYDVDAKAVFAKEAEVFGSTETGQGVRIIPAREQKFGVQKVGKGEWLDAGYHDAYLGYGPLLFDRNLGGSTSHNDSRHREAIVPGSVFNFRACGTDGQINELKKCLMLLSIFGGLGSRNRRGWGSVWVEGLDLHPPNDPTQMRSWFGQQAQELTGFDLLNPTHTGSEPAYSAFSSLTHAKIKVLTQSKSYRDVFAFFYKIFKDTRLYDFRNPGSSPPVAQSDHTTECRDWSSHAPKRLSGIPQRLAFGMPYNPGNNRKRPPWMMEYGGTTKAGELTVIRRASPIHLKVFQNPNGTFSAVALFLRSQFFGDPTMRMGAKGFTNILPFPGWGAINQFMNHRNW
ncbi:hypothetical protein JW992_16490 [candidate division KSB1 bacterium]|nr:hypothetical protein [candidate division KSB1 bacterium]